MSTFTINLPDDRLRALKKLSNRLNISPEELVRLSIEEILTRPEETYRQAIEYIVDKNSDLYQRLAA